MNADSKMSKTFRIKICAMDAYKIYSLLCQNVLQQFDMKKEYSEHKEATSKDFFSNEQVFLSAAAGFIPNAKFQYIQVAAYCNTDEYIPDVEKCLAFCCGFLAGNLMEEIEL